MFTRVNLLRSCVSKFRYAMNLYPSNNVLSIGALHPISMSTLSVSEEEAEPCTKYYDDNKLLTRTISNTNTRMFEIYVKKQYGSLDYKSIVDMIEKEKDKLKEQLPPLITNAR